MTESEWPSATDPWPMLEYLLNADRVSERRLRLFACATARLFEARRNRPEIVAVIEACEQVADETLTQWGLGEKGLLGARKSIEAVWGWVWAATCVSIDHGLRDTFIQVRGNSGNFYRQEEVATLLRGVFGNPFRRTRRGRDLVISAGTVLSLDKDGRCVVAGPGDVPFGVAAESCWAEDQGRVKAQVFDNRSVPTTSPPSTPPLLLEAWLTPDVSLLARTAYQSTDPATGHMDVACLAALADALEEAGCNDARVLRHLKRGPVCVWCLNRRMIQVPLVKGGPERGPERKNIVRVSRTREVPCPTCAEVECGPSVKGDWVVDLVLGKE